MNELPFTGERYVPGLKGLIAYEHVHRYALCADLVTGRRVLDVACGEGYGSNFMARTALSVVGVDIDPTTIHHAEVKYQSVANLSFCVGDCRSIALQSGSVDIVVSFETVEHIAEHDEMIAEIKRVLTPTGTLIISSPDRRTYSEKTGHINEFHVRELTKNEFRELLSRHFKTVHMYGQRDAIGSFVIAEAAGHRRTLDFFMRGSHGFEAGAARLADPVYHIAVCGDDASSMPTLSSSVHIDPKDDVLRELIEGYHNLAAARPEQIARYELLQQDRDRLQNEFAEHVARSELLQQDRVAQYELLQQDCDRLRNEFAEHVARSELLQQDRVAQYELLQQDRDRLQNKFAEHVARSELLQQDRVAQYELLQQDRDRLQNEFAEHVARSELLQQDRVAQYELLQQERDRLQNEFAEQIARSELLQQDRDRLQIAFAEQIARSELLQQDRDRLQIAFAEQIARSELLQQDRDRLQIAFAEQVAQSELFERHLDAIVASSSWQITRPIRAALARVPGFAQFLRRALKLIWWAMTFRLPGKLRERYLLRHPVTSPQVTNVSALAPNGRSATSAPQDAFSPEIMAPIVAAFESPQVTNASALAPNGRSATSAPQDAFSPEIMAPIVAAFESQAVFNVGWYGDQPLASRDRYKQVPLPVAALEAFAAEKYERDTQGIWNSYFAHLPEPSQSPADNFLPNARVMDHFTSVLPGRHVADSSTNPTFSFVTPFFNDLAFFEQCARSMAELISAWPPTGSGSRLEWVVGNDDPSVSNEMLRERIPEALQPFVTILGDGTNHGITRNLNRAILASRNEWVLFLDYDDLVMPEVVPVLTHYIRKFSKCRYISSGMIDIDDTNRVLRYRRHSRPPTELFSAGMVAGHLKAVRKDLFDEIGLLDSSFDLAQDYEFALRAAAIEPLLLIPDYLYCYRWHHKTQSVSNIVPQNLARDRIRSSLVLRLAEQGLLGGRAISVGPNAAYGLKSIRRGACIIRTQGQRLELLSETIASVEGQSLPLAPVVVVHGDDEMFRDIASWCQEGGSSAVCLQAALPRRRLGYPANVGLDYITARADEFDFVCLLDDDDIFYSNFAERMAAALTFGGADLVYAEAARRVPWTAPEVGPRLLPPSCLIGGNFITVNSFALRLSALIKTGVRFEEDMHYQDDWNFLVKLLGLGVRFMPLFETLCEFRIFGDGNIPARNFPDLFKICQQKMVAKCMETAKALGPEFFYASIADFDFSARMPLEQGEISLMIDARSRFEATCRNGARMPLS